MSTDTLKVDINSFFEDLLYFLDQCDSNDMLAGYEIQQAESVRDAVAELIDAAKKGQVALEHSRAQMAHYPEAANRHTDAYRAICAAVARLEVPHG